MLHVVAQRRQKQRQPLRRGQPRRCAALAQQDTRRVRHVAHVPPVVKRCARESRQKMANRAAVIMQSAPLSACAARAAETKARSDARSTPQLSITPALAQRRRRRGSAHNALGRRPQADLGAACGHGESAHRSNRCSTRPSSAAQGRRRAKVSRKRQGDARRLKRQAGATAEKGGAAARAPVRVGPATHASQRRARTAR